MSTLTISELPLEGQLNFDANSSQARSREIEEEFKKNNLPKGFYFDEHGLWFRPEPDDSNQPSPTYISSRLDVTAVVRDSVNENHGRLLEFYDSDAHKHVWVMPMELLAGDGTEYRRELLSKGLIIAPGNKPRQYLTQFIQVSQPIARARCVLQTGWFQNYYVFPNETIGANKAERILYQSLSSNHFGYGCRGILEEWQKIPKLCRGNSRLIFALSASFAAPMLSLLGEENGGFHFRGQSSTGKSTALKVACSIWGGQDYLQSWRATSNGLEGVAAAHNDALLCLDEIEEIHAAEIGGVAYMLANGVGKTRSDKFGIARKKASWKLLFLSTGEISLADHIRQSGKNVRAGQEVRIIDIPSDTGKFGIFENLHGFENGDAFSKHLCKACLEHHGVAAREFLRCLINDKEDALSHVKDLMASFQSPYLPKNASGQVSRAFHRFALVAAAGELATQFGITGWEIGEAANAVMICFHDWLQARGSVGMQEEDVAIAQVRKFFEMHGSSRFGSIQLEPPESKTMNRAGFKKFTEQGIEYLVLPEVFKSEICAGLDFKFVSKICIQHGLLIPGSDGKATRPERIPALSEKSTVRVYKFSSNILLDDFSESGVYA